MVIDEEGNKLGEISKADALAIATERELDLVEVSPNAKPPVAKIMSWSKFKYQLDKKKKEAKHKAIDQKEMWFKSFIGDGDLDHKIKKVLQFLGKKHPVKITIKAKGRTNKSEMDGLLEKIIAKLDGLVEYDNKSKFNGRNLSLIVRPVQNFNKLKKERENEKQN